MASAGEPVLGIDLGTTNSVVATLVDNKIEIIPDSQGNRLHPSVVAFVLNGDVLVGHAALENNEPLGVLTLHSIPPRPRGQTQIEVTFTIDSDGILSVSAKDVESGQRTYAAIRVLGAPEAEVDPSSLPAEAKAIDPETLPVPN